MGRTQDAAPSLGRRALAGAAALLALPAQAQAPALREIAVGVASPSTVAAAPRLAKALGLYSKRGLDPRFIMLDSANAATAALIAGSVKLAVSGPGELVAAQARGVAVVAVANTYAGLGASLVLAKGVAERSGVRADAPVADRLRALDGLLIASTTATSSYTVALRGAAKAAGAGPRFTYMAQAAMPAALESGAVQGFFTSAPFWAIPVAKGLGTLWISAPKGELPPAFTPASSADLQAMRAFAEAEPALMRDMAAVQADLGTAIAESPDRVKAVMAELYPGLDAATLDLIFGTESIAWRTRPLTVADMAHDIGLVKAGGTALPGLDALDPAARLLR